MDSSVGETVLGIEALGEDQYTKYVWLKKCEEPITEPIIKNTYATGWEPLWTTISEASQAYHELIHCGCKKVCTRQCKCVNASLSALFYASARENVNRIYVLYSHF